MLGDGHSAEEFVRETLRQDCERAFARRMDMRRLVGRNLERIGRGKGMTQEELAAASGFTVSVR